MAKIADAGTIAPVVPESVYRSPERKSRKKEGRIHDLQFSLPHFQSQSSENSRDAPQATYAIFSRMFWSRKFKYGKG